MYLLIIDLLIFMAGIVFGICIFWLIQKLIKKYNFSNNDFNIENMIKAVASDALRENQTSFLELAKATFDENQKLTKFENERAKESIKNFLKPVTENLKQYNENLKKVENERKIEYGAITTEIRNVADLSHNLQKETTKLTTALRANPNTRGRWGEETLKNVMELAGMTPHVDFEIEKSFFTGDKKLRPDAIIKMPGGRSIVVDAKTSMTAYLDSINSDDETEKENYLLRHTRQIRSHMKNLSSKEYWSSLKNTPDFVIMFIPGENFYSVALERDSNLFTDGINEHVVIATPTTLITLVKVIAYSWRQESISENYQEIAHLGSEIYKKLSLMGSNLDALGGSIKTSVQKFNKLIGNIETSVMPQARKFQEFGVETSSKKIKNLDYISEETRNISRNKDIKIINN